MVVSSPLASAHEHRRSGDDLRPARSPLARRPHLSAIRRARSRRSAPGPGESGRGPDAARGRGPASARRRFTTRPPEVPPGAAHARREGKPMLPKWLLGPLAVGRDDRAQCAPAKRPDPSSLWTDVDWYDRLHTRCGSPPPAGVAADLLTATDTPSACGEGLHRSSSLVLPLSHCASRSTPSRYGWCTSSGSAARHGRSLRTPRP